MTRLPSGYYPWTLSVPQPALLLQARARPVLLTLAHSSRVIFRTLRSTTSLGELWLAFCEAVRFQV